MINKIRLRMIAKANPDRNIEYQKLWQEAQELSLIFSSILLLLDKRKKFDIRNLGFGFNFNLRLKGWI
ncbi:hypothetical protein NLD30_00955 [SCandidatus Aminicenantes bacterium Aminicenantia_JdfR_composite]|nr:hypothetical protein [SCandidatus Aminicenantes bacterium Aminicenantia_JdfR_composite]MCP2598028.1 hypothetical protein [Candidatus Aminicenantes bacterium AC-335-L06]MCP2620959.1 hypothetical protein [Candidatus Aminicenantes bacterium AC-334-E05]